MIVAEYRTTNKTRSFLARLLRKEYLKVLDKYGREGVNALSSATPTDSGLTAASWSYKISSSSGGYRISWENSHIVNGVNIAVILKTGHGTGTGGYVQGRDYITPTMRPIFDNIAKEAWRAVTG